MDKKNENNVQQYINACRKGIGDIFMITVIAAAAGFVSGLLFAPRSGKETRKLLDRSARELLDRARFAMLEARVKSEEFLEKGMEKAEKISSQAKREK
jgi:gas vesicle protein